MKNNKLITIAGIFLLSLLFSSFVSAFGTSYIFERPLSLYPDQTKNIYVTLQNNNDENPILAKATLKQDAEIAKLTDGLEEFVVPYRTSVRVNFSVSAPKNAKVGDVYKFDLKFIPQETTGSGMGIVFASGLNLDIIIVEPISETPIEIKEQPSITGVLVFIVLAIIIISVIILTLIRRKKNKSKKK